MARFRKPIKQALTNLNDDKFYSKNDNKINFMQDILSYPTFKNSLARENHSAIKNKVKQENIKFIDKLRKKLIFPNNFEHKINLQINKLKREYLDKKV